MRAISRRWAQTKGLIERVCNISGSFGMSCGVILEGKILYTDNVGFLDVEKKLPQNSDTIYHEVLYRFCHGDACGAEEVGSGTKLLDILPVFHQKTEGVEKESNVIDFLAHQIGLTSRINCWAQMHQQLLLPASEAINVLGALETTRPFRNSLKYNNWTYSSAADIIEHAAGEKFGEFNRRASFPSS